MKPDHVICEFLGGSHLYGLNTPESDEDVRGVFVNTDSAFILGTRRFDEARKQNHTIKEDVVYKEVSHVLRLLHQANSEALEMLFAPQESFTFLHKDFQTIRDNHESLVDSKKLFNCLRGYMQGEYRLAIGERKGQIGGKRYAKLQEVGFSPKNFTQLFRLAYCGIMFFKSDRFPVNLKKEAIYDELMAIKTTPEKYSKEQLTEAYLEAEKDLVDAFENRVRDRQFDEEVANKLLLTLYFPHLRNQYRE
jgi:hypothetical protein